MQVFTELAKHPEPFPTSVRGSACIRVQRETPLTPLWPWNS